MTKHNTDLSFKPVNNEAPRTLTPSQVDFYNREGYLFPLNLFSPREAEQNRAYFNGLLAQSEGRNAYALNCYQTRCAGIYDLCMAERILDVVEDIVGPNIICWATHYFCKMPHDEKRVPWHQDASYWKLSPARTVTVWLAIDDADEENAAMRFIPRTHDMGPLRWRAAEGPAVLDQEIVDVASLGEPVSDILKAGQISLHADMLAHGSEPNASDRRRCGLTLRFCPPEVRIVDEHWKESVHAIICRGEDPTGRWEHNPRPDSDDASHQDDIVSLGGN